MSDLARLQAALLDERLLNARRTHLVRFWALSFFALLFVVLGVARSDTRWHTNLGALAAWWAFSAAAAFASRANRRLAVWLTLAPGLIDMPLVYVVQRAQYASTPSPSGVAGFTLGVYALLLAVASLSATRWQLWVMTASAAFWEVLLQAEADVSLGGMVAAVVVLALTAQILIYASDRRLELVRQMARTEKLASLGKLSASVGHELRNPLAAASNALFVLGRELRRHGAPTQATDEPLRLVERELKNAARITGDLLDYAREAPLEREPVELGPLLDECASVLRSPGAARIRTDAQSRTVRVLGSRDRLRQVFVNILQNAADAIPAGRDGAVSVEAHVLSNARVEVKVKDDGVGMDAETRRRALEPLFTTKRHGNGLGLAIVDSLVREHGGTLELQSAPGAGTTVSVILPMATGS